MANLTIMSLVASSELGIKNHAVILRNSSTYFRVLVFCSRLIIGKSFQVLIVHDFILQMANLLPATKISLITFLHV